MIDFIVCSPPYAESTVTSGNAGNVMMKEKWGKGGRLSPKDGYGVSKGQLSSMKPGDPPFGKQSMKTKTTFKTSIWKGCYDENWKGVITNESFAHPAKMARGLVKRIFKHLREQYGLEKGMMVVDPFGGIGTTAIEGTTRGCLCLLVELEPRFVEMAKKNFKIHERYWKARRLQLPVIVQGDSRELRKLLYGGADAVVGSPPFSEAQSGSGINKSKVIKTADGRSHALGNDGYNADVHGNTPGNLGTLKPGSVDSIISSPPYAETVKGDGTAKETAKESRAKRRTEGGSLGQSQRHQGYGGKRNLGNLKAGEVDDCLGGINLASQQNSSTMPLCKNDVRTVASRSADEPAGANRAQKSMSANRLKGERSPQDTEQRLRLPSKEGRCPTIGDQPTKTGLGEAIAGEDTTGERRDDRQKSAIDIGASAAGQRDFSKSTTRKTQAKRAVSGTTNSATSKRSAHNATLQVTETKSAQQPVQSAARYTSQGIEMPAAHQNAEKKLSSERGLNSTGKTARLTSVRLVESSSNSLGADGSIAHDNASDSDGPKTHESDEQEPSTFWESALTIVRECHAILKPGGIAVWVTKDFVRNKKRVPFSNDWRKLCEACGFEMVEWVQASLVKKWTVQTLFGDVQKERKRASFFRRLAERKGSPRIDEEDVLIMRRRKGGNK